jgi:hypothetical protein
MCEEPLQVVFITITHNHHRKSSGTCQTGFDAAADHFRAPLAHPIHLVRVKKTWSDYRTYLSVSIVDLPFLEKWFGDILRYKDQKLTVGSERTSYATSMFSTVECLRVKFLTYHTLCPRICLLHPFPCSYLGGTFCSASCKHV